MSNNLLYQNETARNEQIESQVVPNSNNLQYQNETPIISRLKESKLNKENKREERTREQFSENLSFEQKDQINEAEGGKCNNIAKANLGDLSAQIGVSYANTQKAKENALEVPKNENYEFLPIESDSRFDSEEVFCEYWAKFGAKTYPKIDPVKAYHWFVGLVKSQYNGKYQDYFAKLGNFIYTDRFGDIHKLFYENNLSKSAQSTNEMLNKFVANGGKSTIDL